MSRENVETVRKLIEALQVGGTEALLAEFITDETVWYPFPAWVEDSEYRGKSGVRKVMGVWTDNFDDFAVELHSLRDAGDKVVALTVMTGKIQGTGVPIHQHVGIVNGDFRHGTSLQSQFFESWDEALQAAGLTE